VVESDRDVAPEIIGELLKFIYSDKAPSNLADIAALGLLNAAVKYQLTRLQCLCECALLKALSIQNARDVTIAAHLSNAKELKVKSLKWKSLFDI